MTTHSKNEGRYDDLFSEAAPRLELFLRLRTGDRDVLDDLHEVYLTGRGAFGRFQERGPDSFLRWMCSIARNHVVDGRRRAGRSPVERASGRTTMLQVLDGTGAAPGPATDVERAEARTRLMGAIDGLDEIERAVLLGHTFEGQSQGEIAEALGISTSTVQRAMARALTAVGRAVRGS